MRQVYFIQETEAVRKIYTETYPYFMAALKARNPNAKVLNEDYELSQLHNLSPFVRFGHVRVNDSHDGIILLELFEELPQSPFKPLPFIGFNT